MPVGRTTNILGQMRLDVPMFRQLDGGDAYDSDVLAGRVLADARPLVVRGFKMLVAGAVGRSADSLVLQVAGGILINITATEAGSVLRVPDNRTDETLRATNARVDGGFTANSTNYVGLDLLRSADETTSDTAHFLDQDSNEEFPAQVPLARTLDYRIVISTTTFASTPNLVPISIVATDPQNRVSSIQDARSLLFRLGTGGSNPQVVAPYAWPGTRNELTAADPSIGGDRAITGLKSWVDSMMTRLWEVGGGEYWYSGTADRNVLLGSSVVFSSTDEPYEVVSGHVHWKGLVFTFDNSTGVVNEVADQLVALNGLTNLLDGECLYVDLDRSQDRTGGNAIVAQKGVLKTLGQSSPPGSRTVFAWRLGGQYYFRGLQRISTRPPPLPPASYGDSSHYVDSVTTDVTGQISAVGLRAFSDNLDPNHGGVVVLTGADPSGPLTNPLFFFDSPTGLNVQHRTQGWYDLCTVFTSAGVSGLRMGAASTGQLLATTGGVLTIDGIENLGWAVGSTVTIHFLADAFTTIQIRSLQTTPANSYKICTPGASGVFIPPGTRTTLTFCLDNQTGSIGGPPVWVQVNVVPPTGIVAGNFGGTPFYIAGLTADTSGRLSNVEVRSLADNLNTNNTGYLLMTGANPSGPLTNPRVRFDNTGLIVQDKIQGFIDVASVSPSNGVALGLANAQTFTGGGGTATVDGFDYSTWEYGSEITINFVAGAGAITVRHLQSPPINCRALYLAGGANIVIPAGTRKAIKFCLTSYTSFTGGAPVWAEVGDAPGVGGGGGTVNQVHPGGGITITGTLGDPVVNNAGVLSTIQGPGMLITGSAQNPNFALKIIGSISLGGFCSLGSTQIWFVGGDFTSQIPVPWEIPFEPFIAAGATTYSLKGFVFSWTGNTATIAPTINGSFIFAAGAAIGVGQVGTSITLGPFAIPGGSNRRMGLSASPSGSAQGQVAYLVTFS